MVIDIITLTITVVSIMLFLRVYWIQAGSNSLISMMNMQKKEVLNEIEIGDSCNNLDRETIIGAFSYLNLVSKLYLNYCININMLRTFEGVMIKLLKDEKAKKIYKEIYNEFRDIIKSSEPPYMNLVYTTNMLVNINKRLNSHSFLSSTISWFYMINKKIFFNIHSSNRRNWSLASKVFESL